jgi:antitoxin component of RelBE/YafQ-DinJ toxin-antitoxin module
MTKDEIVQARVDPEIKKKIAEDMKKLGIKKESEYIRKLVEGEIPLLREIKEQLNRIEKKIDEK